MLDNALREAAFGRGVQVRLLVSCWLHTDPGMFPYLRSLQAFSDPAAGISVDVVSTPAPGPGGGRRPLLCDTPPPLCPRRKSSSCPWGTTPTSRSAG